MESVRDPNVNPQTTARCLKHHPTPVQPVVVVIWMCVYDRKVYIFKKAIDIFSEKGVLRGEGAQKNVCSSYTNALVRHYLPCCLIHALKFKPDLWGEIAVKKH